MKPTSQPERVSAKKDTHHDHSKSQRPANLLTVPNALSAIRLLGSPILVVLAWMDKPYWCLGAFFVLVVTDWLDGRLARLLRQETIFGARLDSAADVFLYGCMLLAVSLLHWHLIWQEAIWIGVAIASYGLSIATAFLKFHHLPSYHTWMAKTSWLFMGIGVLAIFTGWSLWLLRGALAGVVITNVEATAITLILPRWQVNVPSMYHALRIRRKSGSVS